ncbi:MAG TPA: hypothetical protein VF559_05685 [Caulobacteraceae bacterium]|jgi:hypothetical protein
MLLSRLSGAVEAAVAGLSEKRASLVRALVQGAPDHALLSLNSALSGCAHDGTAMGQVQALVAGEAADRRVRDEVFAPVAPLFGPAAAASGLQGFPASVLRRIWAGLKRLAPEQVRLAASAGQADEEQAAALRAACDELCARAAAELRAAEEPEFATCSETLGADGVERLCTYLDLCRIARSALERLPEWLGRHTDERTAAARLAYRDAGSVLEDGGPRLVEMLAAHLEEPWQALRLVSVVMNRPPDAFAAGSELRLFGERLLDETDRRLAAVIGFQPAKGAEAGAAAAREVQAAAVCLAEMEAAFELSPSGPWGSRVGQQKRTLAGLVEPRIKLTEEAVARALPLQTGRLGRDVRGHPRLDQAAEPAALAKAQALAAFTAGVRTAAAAGGFTALRAAVTERLEARLHQYVEDLLEVLHGAAAEADKASARALLDVAADLLEILIDGKAAKVARRRAAAA